MKTPFPSALLAIGILLLVFTRPLAAADEPKPESLPPALVTQQVLESKIAEIKAATGINEEAKNRLVELYRKALTNLQKAASNAQAAEAFGQAADSAPVDAQALREAMSAASIAGTPDAGDSALLPQVDQLLQTEKAELAALDARRADFEKRLEEEQHRPAMIRQRLTEAKQQQEEVAAQIKMPPPGDESRAMTEARTWMLETRYQALSAEIKMLDQELLSQPMRLDLLQAERDKAATSLESVGERVGMLQQLASEKRRQKAEQAREDAETSRREAEGRHVSVVHLAEQNALLSEQIAGMVSRLDELENQVGRADKLARRIEDDFKSAEETIAIGGLNQQLGQMLLQQWQSLPDQGLLRRRVGERRDKAAAIGVQRLQHRQEQKHLFSLGSFVDEVLSQAGSDDTPLLRTRLHDLAEQRKTLLEKAIESDDFFLRKLGELEAVQGRLLDAIENYDRLLQEHLLWVRTASHLQLEEVGALPRELWRMLSDPRWPEVPRILAYQATHSPTLVLLSLALIALLWQRKRLLALIESFGRRVGSPRTDRFGLSVATLILTLVVATTWPLLMAVTGWQLKVSAEATGFSTAVGGSLLAGALQFYYLRAFSLMCMPSGLAAAHFRWPDASLDRLRQVLNRLTWTFVPAVVVGTAAVDLDPLHTGWAIGRASLLIQAASLGFAFYHLLHPTQGALAATMARPDRQALGRARQLWFPILVATPVILGLLSLTGFLYTASTLFALLVETTWLLVALLLLAALARRWVRGTRRSLAYEAAMEERRALRESDRTQEQTGTPEETMAMEVEEPEVDLGALSDTSRELLNTTIFVLGLVGLWMIWSEVFPALRIFEDVTLWHRTAIVDGDETLRPFTLADIGLALILGAATVILAKRLPAMQEMILLEHFEMSAGSRYTITTLTTYAVIATGIILVLNTIGAQWSQLQWLVAALSVGIGFGLQEIVANFISGIIILFERPIRIGDVVTIGDTDGVVTKIRIRATTIRNWDRKELLVPNKEFVTGRLLNWSLSDQITRVVIVVGVAYGSDVDKAHELMREAAEENEQVLDDPPPVLSFEAFGDSALTLMLRAYLGAVDQRVATITDLHKAINRKFAEAGITIAFPQRDLHLDTQGPLQVSIVGSENGPSGNTDAGRSGNKP